MPTSTFQLTRSMALGDEVAIDRFYRDYFPWLLLVARRTTGRDESFCLDVVQEATLKILRCVRPIDEEGRLRAWLELVVQSTAYDLLQAEARRSRREARFLKSSPRVETAFGFETTQRLAWLKSQLALLDPDLARLIDLRYEQCWPLGRMADVLGLSIGTIDGRLRRAIQHLRQLAPEGLHD